MSHIRIDLHATGPDVLARTLRHLAAEIEDDNLGPSAGHGGVGYKALTEYDPTPRENLAGEPYCTLP